MKDLSGCLKYSGKLCVECGFETELVNGTCSGILFCSDYSEDGKCRQCGWNYTLSNNNNTCIDTSSDCEQVDQKTGLCVKCRIDSNLMGFSCVPDS